MHDLIIFLMLLGLIRTAYILLDYKTINYDSYLYLILAENIRRKIIRKKRIKSFIDKPSFPVLFPIILSLIPKKLIKKIFIFIPVIFELINFLIFYLFIKSTGIENPNITYVFLLFIFYPLYTSIYPGPRTYKSTPRIISEVLMNSAFLFIFLYLISNKIGFLLIAYFIGGLVLLTSKFGFQVMLFFMVPLFLLLGSIEIFLFPFIAFGIATLVSKGDYLRVFKGHMLHLKLYFKQIQYFHPVILAREKNKLSIFKKEGFKKFLASILLESDIFNFFIKNYLGPFVIILIFFNGNFVHPFFLYWFLISIIIYILTTIKFLRFLGEPERYLFYSCIALFILFAQFNLGKNIYQILLICEILYFILIGFAIYIREKDKTKNKKIKNEDEIIEIIKKNNYNNILPIQLTPPLRIIYETEKNFCVSFDYFKHFDIYRKVILPINDLEKIRKKYSFKFILINKEYLEEYNESLKEYEEVFENYLYKIYAVRDKEELKTNQIYSS